MKSALVTTTRKVNKACTTGRMTADNSRRIAKPWIQCLITPSEHCSIYLKFNTEKKNSTKLLNHSSQEKCQRKTNLIPKIEERERMSGSVRIRSRRELDEQPGEGSWRHWSEPLGRSKQVETEKWLGFGTKIWDLGFVVEINSPKPLR